MRSINNYLEPYLKTIKPNKPLGPKLANPSVGQHLYKNGILFFKKPGLKPKFFYNPYFIYAIQVLYFVRSVVSLFIPESDEKYFVYSGDYMYFINAKIHINVAATQYFSIGLSVLTLNYWRYRHGNAPVFLDSLEWLAGRDIPKNVGIQNPQLIMRMVIKSRLILTVTFLNTVAVFIGSFLLSFIPLFLYLTWTEIALYGIPWSLVFTVSSYHNFSNYFWNNAYFYIICHQFKVQLEEVDNMVKRIIAKPQLYRPGMANMIRQKYMKIGAEVKRFSRRYFANYLFLVIFFLATFNNTVLYTAIFNERPHISVRLLLIYASSLACMGIFFMLNTASLVYRQSNRSRLLLHGFYIAIRRRAHYRSLLKISTLIEDVTRKRVGFYFFNLFVIKYFKFYEIIGFMLAYFLKITEMSFTGQLI